MIVTAPWWVRPGLDLRDGRLTIAGRDAEELARRHGTPLYVYDLARFGETAGELKAALTGAGLTSIVRFALKANREPQVLAILRSVEGIGIDACSPW